VQLTENTGLQLISVAISTYGEIETQQLGYVHKIPIMLDILRKIGKIYQQKFIDTDSRLAFAKVYTEKIV
jgi:hypothetical protein